MSEKRADDLIIKNVGAVGNNNEGERYETSENKLGVNDGRRIQEVIGWIHEKFKKKELVEKDFENALKEFGYDEYGNERKGTEDSWGEDLDKIMPVDLELDFQDGEIKVTSATGKEGKNEKCNEKENRKEGRNKIGKGQDEKQINKQMKQLMATFEQEKKNLLRKVEIEKELIAKQVADDYERKLKVEKDFLGTVIADLVKSVEDANLQINELQLIREHDRITLQKFFKRKLAEEKRKILMEVCGKNGMA